MASTSTAHVHTYGFLEINKRLKIDKLREVCKKDGATIAESCTVRVGSYVKEIVNDAEILKILTSATVLMLSKAAHEAFPYFFRQRNTYDYFEVVLEGAFKYDDLDPPTELPYAETMVVDDAGALKFFTAPALKRLAVCECSMLRYVPLTRYRNLISLEVTMKKCEMGDDFFEACLTLPYLFKLVLVNLGVGLKPLSKDLQSTRLRELTVSCSKPGFHPDFYAFASRLSVLSFRGQIDNSDVTPLQLRDLQLAPQGMRSLDGLETLRVEHFKEKWDRMQTGTWGFYYALTESHDVHLRSLRRLDLYVLSYFFSQDFVSAFDFVPEVVWRAMNWSMAMVSVACRCTKTNVLGFGGEGGIGELLRSDLDSNPTLSTILFFSDASDAARVVAQQFESDRSGALSAVPISNPAVR